ncbi:MAG: hypothetical protein ACR2LQ_08350 [Acidimicrobiales bacterium]
MPVTGACPTCGRILHAASAVATVGAAGDTDDHLRTDGENDYKAPWHFKLMVAMAVVYLTWRFVQLATWLL